MKQIRNLTEDQALDLLPQIITRRAVRAATIVRDLSETISRRFIIEVETYSAEEETGGLAPPDSQRSIYAFVPGDRVRYVNTESDGPAGFVRGVVGVLRMKNTLGNWEVVLPGGGRVWVSPTEIERVK